MKSYKQIIAEKAIKEAITITTSNIMKYLKTIQRDIGAKDILISPVKNGLWQICFVEPRTLNGNLYLLMKNKDSGTKIGVAYVIGYNVLGTQTNEVLDDFYQLPHTVRKFSDLKLSIRILQNLKGVAKDPKTMAMRLDVSTSPDLGKEINKQEIKNVNVSGNDLTKSVFSSYEDDLAEIGISKVEIVVPNEITVIKNGNEVLLFSNSATKIIVIKVDNEPTHFIDFKKGRFEVVSKLSKQTEQDTIIQTALGAFAFKFIYCVENVLDGYKITGDFINSCYSVYTKLSTALKAQDVLSMIFMVNETMTFQVAESKIAKDGYVYDECAYFNSYGIGGWVILETFIEGKKI